MTTTLHKNSARIYQFPAGGRAGIASRGRETQTSTANVAPMYATYPVRIASGSGWYHEAALLEEDQSHKN